MADQRAAVFSFMMVNFFLWNTVGTQLSGFLTRWLPAGVRSPYEWPLVLAGILALAAGIGRALVPFQREQVAVARLNVRPSRTAISLGTVNFLSGATMALLATFANVILAKRFGSGGQSIATILTVGGIVGWFGARWQHGPLAR